MALLSAVDAARVLGVDDRSLRRKKEQLQQMGMARRVGRRLMYESDGLEEAFNSLSELQPANAERLMAAARADVESAAQIPDYTESRAKREFWQARLAELMALEREGQLVDAAAANKRWVEVVRRFRDRVLGVVPRVSADLAAEDSDVKGAILLERALVAALEGMRGAL